MIILDTNIVSEFMTAPPAAAVVDWLNRQDARTLFLTSITVAEICYGLNAMPAGKRRNILSGSFDVFITTSFAGRILAFDESAARLYGEIVGKRKKQGRPMSSLDGQIAAIARVHGFALATRNLKDFANCQVELINPFG